MKKYSIHMKDRTTGTKLILVAHGENVDDATRKLAGTLFGINGQYIWTGSEPHE